MGVLRKYVKDMIEKGEAEDPEPECPDSPIIEEKIEEK